MFTWGHGNTGALGHGDNEDQLQPRAVPPFGQQSSKDGDGDVDMYGDGDATVSAGAVDPDSFATSVSCGAWHTVVLTASGRVFAFGDGFTGQLGLEDRGDIRESRALAPRGVRIERNAGGSGGSPGDVFVTQVHLVLLLFLTGTRGHGRA